MSFADTNPEAWARGRERAAAGDQVDDDRGAPWDDLGGNPDDAAPRQRLTTPKPRPENVAPPVDVRPGLSDASRQIIADIRRTLRDEPEEGA